VVFSSENDWFRDYLICSGCGSIPRERALLKVLSECFPSYRSLAIHESSPCGRGASVKLQRECPQYTSSQFYPDLQPGTLHPKTGFRCENLEQLTFPDNSLDLFVTQDVMEHIFHPGKAFHEIARVLRPGGAHVFTAPLINKARKTERWASLGANGEILFHHPAEYHGNPVDAKGALVTMHWGYDIAAFILEAARTPTVIFQIDDIDKGIRAEYIDVLVSGAAGGY
jgi:SAM-dependent methyltransferase